MGFQKFRTLGSFAFSAVMCIGCASADDQTLAATELKLEPAMDAESRTAPAETVGRRFEFQDTVVLTRTDLDALPEQATIVRFTSTLIDSGNGLELCLGGVAESEPPQCAGPVVDGLDPEGWTKTSTDVTWGTRSVTVAWPPVDGQLTLIGDEASTQLQRIGDEQSQNQPHDCERIVDVVNDDALALYADANPDRTAGVSYEGNNGGAVLFVPSEHLADVRSELATLDSEPCLQAVKYSTTELDAAHARLLSEGLHSPVGPILSSGRDSSLNRITVGLAVADRRTISIITAVFDDPAILRFVGAGEIIE
jgi:hypothetical protein